MATFSFKSLTLADLLVFLQVMDCERNFLPFFSYGLSHVEVIDIFDEKLTDISRLYVTDQLHLELISQYFYSSAST